MRSWSDAVDATSPAVPFMLVVLFSIAVGVLIYLYRTR